MNKKSQRPSILDTVYFLDEMNLGSFANKKRQPLKFSYPPSKLKIEIDGTYSWKGNIPDALIVDPIIFNNYARAFKKWQFDNGYLNNDDSIYIACHLLEKYPHIAESLVRRFPYVIIDEAQDTSEIQYKIFDLLIKAGLKNIEFVGDPYQSLYEFREARPDLFIKRHKDMTFNSTLLVLSANSTGANISINDFNTPVDMPSEKQRLIYVALSRAEVLSCLAVPDSISEADIVAKLGNHYEF